MNMFNFREINYAEDIDDIIDLLNANFNSDHKKESFLWKHFRNPFGRSYGLLAEDNGKIVGLRMFMRWEFICNKKTIKAIRPVDTCTDTTYRGKGLFKKLTLQGLENIKSEYELVFNTPNENSRPGYLKMGWETDFRDFEYKLGIINPFRSPIAFKNIIANEIRFKESWIDDHHCQTLISEKYFKWRFKDEDYQIAEFIDGSILIYKIRRLKGIKTLILIDIFGDNKEYLKMIYSVGRHNNAFVAYYLKLGKGKQLKFLWNMSRNKQVVVTRDDKFDLNGKVQLSVADLEGRI